MKSERYRVKHLKDLITASCVICKLNLTIYDGKLGFVDQRSKRIVAVWSPAYTLKDNETEANIDNVIDITNWMS